MNVNWEAFVTAEPDLARTVEQRFGAYTHHVLATLRKDGSPRTTGLEVRFFDGELWFGMMPDSRKALDLRRDPRFALQANPGEGTGMGGGDVRISGRAFEVDDEEIRRKYTRGQTDATEEAAERAAEAAGNTGSGKETEEKAEEPERFHLFRTELTEVVRTYVEDEKYLVMQVWKPGEPVRTLKRT
ncbi:pyridoxamine 5'-phosphate oxidase family protein [Streptomyces sp. SBST2-5]|uniref:Pyridoxamine 5'-phosphate oxidase family protein n=1 Tax=Streptomyces composti TaxID=2720025 RepID=A0ABX1A7T3_9ACTN|nr:pyridoxamine 5'-phosphate oxidase family protein [Streptomyces composti]NJP50636.1 pyridoxamine 5'-phosphate oxidase family protein [Streptomyces composti]